jgi:hypothetical protein
LVDKKGKAIDGQATFRMRHFMGNNGKVFDLVVQRSSVTGQVELDLELDSNNSTQASEQITTGQYIYRSIATNRQQQFECAYIFGAACPAKDKALGLVLPLANTDGMIEHYKRYKYGKIISF